MIKILLFLSLVFIEKPKQDYKILSKLITSECSICSEEEALLVASVVLNRVESKKFPNTLKEVIFQKNQFYGVKTKWFITTKKSDRIAIKILNSKNRNKNILYFFKENSENKNFVNRMKKENRILIKKKYHVFAK